MESDDSPPRRTCVVGITGGVATGKSAVTRLFQKRGITVFSADEAARAPLTDSVRNAIAEAFGPEMLRPDGSLDRARLAARVFSDPEARERLNRITHPPILRLLCAQIESARKDLPPGSLIAAEVPLLYETELSGWFDYVLVVSASESVQLARLQSRNQLRRAEALRRIRSQMALQDKEARADFLITNNGTYAELEQAVDALIEHLKQVCGTAC
jgi:dephospho-CoA kinase